MAQLGEQSVLTGPLDDVECPHCDKPLRATIEYRVTGQERDGAGVARVLAIEATNITLACEAGHQVGGD